MLSATLPPPMDEDRANIRRAGGSSSSRRGLRLAALAFGVFSSLAVFEVALRLVPQAISPKLLILFEPDLRAHIASGAYPLQKDFRQIARDDGGPPLYVAKPHTRILSIDETADGAERFTDENGFCNAAGFYDGREQIDLITLGDSFSWCHAVVPQQAWPALLGGLSGLPTYSLGRGGNGLYEYVQYFREFGLAKNPRVVILNVYGGNDLRDAVAYQDYRAAVARGEEPDTGDPKPIAPALRDSIFGRHSYALNFLMAAISRLADKDASDWDKSSINMRYDLLLPGGTVAFNVENRDRDEVLFARRREDGSAPMTIWAEALERFGSLAREHGFVAIVTYTPAAYAAYGDLVRLEDPSLAPLLEEFDAAQRRFLNEHASLDGYVFHDLTDDLLVASQHEDASGLLYDPVHVHLSVRGNQVLAESMARFLAEKGLSRPVAP